MRLIDADYMRKQVDMHGTNKYGMLDENIRVFIDQQPTIEPEPHWIPCEENLPPSGTACFVTVECNGEKSTCVSTFDHGTGWSNLEHGERVVSWMKLPEAYDGREELS